MKYVSSLLLLFSFYSTISAQWVRQYPLAKMEQVLDIAIHEDGYGFAAGSNDLLLRMDKQTKKWDLLQTLNKGWRLAAIDYLPQTDGKVVAAGGNGFIISTNGGNTWQEIAGAPIGIHDIRGIAEDHWIISSSIGVFRFNGATWENLNLPAITGVFSAHILSADHIWCLTTGANPKIYATNNGGNTWSTNTDINGPDVIRFYNAQYGVATDGRDVFQSLNGGQTWNLISSNAILNSSTGLTFGASPNVIFSGTPSANPTISVDSGRTWTPLTTGLVAQRSYSVAAASDEEFWVGNDISSIFHTTDAGTGWSETSGPPRTQMQDIHFFSRSVGFAIGNNGMILRTTTGGAEWEDISFGSTRNFLSIHGLQPNDMWIGANQRIFHSSDMGVSWQEKAAFLGGNINDILAISDSRILACSSSGILLRSQNSGSTWDTMYNAGNQLRSIARIDAQRYMATGYNGIILRSEDQGETWLPITPPKPGIQYEQSYFLGQKGWVVSSSFERNMWSTTNAGDSWEMLTLPIDRFWDGVYFITPDTGIVVGRSNTEGRAYITFNGGQNWQSSYTTPFPLFGVSGVPNPNGSAWIFGYGSDIEVLPYCSTLPVIGNLTGDPFPCENDTIMYSITSQDADQFQWSFPLGWQILGTGNNDTVTVRAGRNAGNISVIASNVCGFSGQINFTTTPRRLPLAINIQGDLTPCTGEILTYTLLAQHASVFNWSIPPDWEVISGINEAIIDLQIGFDSGILTAEAGNSCGVSTTLTSLITPFVIPEVAVIVNDNLLSLSVAAATYQWFRNDTLIPDATGPTYVAQDSGQYYAMLTFAAGCAAFSDTVQVTIISSIDVDLRPQSLHIYPVPVSSALFLTLDDARFAYTILDFTGRVLLQDTASEPVVPVSTLPNGLYLIRIEKDGRLYQARFVVMQ